MEAILILIILVIMSAFFSGLEIAMFSVSEAKLRSLAHEKSHVGRQARRVLRIKKRPEKFLVTVLIGNNLVNISAAAIATAAAIQAFGSSGVGIATGGMTLIILIAGEILPKSIAQRHADKMARWSSRLTTLLLFVLTPVSYVLEQMAKLANLLVGGKGSMSGVSEEEVKAMVYMGSESGTVEADEREMIENIFTLNDVGAEDVMTQATDMVALNLGQDIKEIIKIIVETGFSRFPVYSGNIDHIEGVIYTKDIMNELAQNHFKIKNVDVHALIKPAIFVPEQKSLDDLLRAFQKENRHIAIVVNEFGETRGIITLEDILEEIVGEITDEQDSDEKSIIRINNKSILANADVDIEDIENALDCKLDSDKHKSIAWLVLRETGELLEKGDEVTIKNVKVIVEEAEETKLKRLKLIKIR